LLVLAWWLAPARRPAARLEGARPIPPPISSPFGSWRGAAGKRPWRHFGIDIAVPTGTPVLAAADGRVVRVRGGPISGYTVVVVHRDEPDPLATTYHHLSAVEVRPGQRVARGAPLGRSGRGNRSSGPHLHFGVCRRPGGRCGDRITAGWADPVLFWADRDDPCFRPGRRYEPEPLRLTFPVPCRQP
ncbi:MAG TPA: M23 family metallopeptidase, partial [Thermodesulfobacteriota bacterium]|nr:M23 family metallopeptidase [Thermodesulfobacteriota bacterium]